jgi:predicted O-methyltransferase YrrM
MLAPLPETCMTLTREMQEKFPDIKLTRMMGNSVPQPWVMGIYGQSAEVELIDLLYCFVRLLKPRTVVELGCHLGLTTYALGRAAQDNGSECPCQVFSCDIDMAMVATATQRCEGLPVFIEHDDAGQFRYLENADLAFIDCNYENRMKAASRMKPGAVGILHDTRHSPELRPCLDPVPHLHFGQTWRGFSIFQVSP